MGDDLSWEWFSTGGTRAKQSTQAVIKKAGSSRQKKEYHELPKCWGYARDPEITMLIE